MKFVLDANILFSSLMSGKKLYLQLLIQNQCFSPDFLFEEIKKYEDKILKKALVRKNFKEYIREVFSHLVIIPKLAIDTENWLKAYELCKDVDEKDTAYVALSMEMNLTLLTRDKKLYKGLKKKGFENIILFEKFLGYMDKESPPDQND